MDIHLTKRALDDLQDIYEYSLEEWGEKTAQKYLLAFQDAFNLLKEKPELLRINERISSKFTIYNVRKHYIVITVRHGSMNLLEKLKDLEPLLDEEIAMLQKQLRNKQE